MSINPLRSDLSNWAAGELAEAELFDSLRKAFVVLRTSGNTTPFSVLRIDPAGLEGSQCLTAFTSMDNAKSLPIPTHRSIGVVQLSELIELVPTGIGIIIDQDSETVVLTPELLQRFKGETGPIKFESAFAQLVDIKDELKFVDPDNLQT